MAPASCTTCENAVNRKLLFQNAKILVRLFSQRFEMSRRHIDSAISMFRYIGFAASMFLYIDTAASMFRYTEMWMDGCRHGGALSYFCASPLRPRAQLGEGGGFPFSFRHGRHANSFCLLLLPCSKIVRMESTTNLLILPSLCSLMRIDCWLLGGAHPKSDF